MNKKLRNWTLVIALGIITLPLILMYIFLVIETVSDIPPGSILPKELTLENWRFLWEGIPGKANIWMTTLNTFIFAYCDHHSCAYGIVVCRLRSFSTQPAIQGVFSGWCAGVACVSDRDPDYCHLFNFTDDRPVQHIIRSYFGKSFLRVTPGHMDYEGFL